MQQNSTPTNMFGWWKKVVYENYASFNGRARRAEYWYFALANVVIFFPLYILGMIGVYMQLIWLVALGFGAYILGLLAIFIPSLAVGVRRLHDIGKSGWYYLLGCIPLVNIILIVWFFTDGNRFANNYGEDPKNPGGTNFDFDNQS